jgi:hypothetical protein
MKFTITINGFSQKPERVRAAAAEFVKKLEGQEPEKNIQQAIFNCEKPEEQMDLLHERYQKQVATQLEADNLDSNGKNKQ